MMDGMDFMDDMDTEKTHLPDYVHSVHNAHSVHYLDKSNWLKLPNPGFTAWVLEGCSLKGAWDIDWGSMG